MANNIQIGNGNEAGPLHDTTPTPDQPKFYTWTKSDRFLFTACGGRCGACGNTGGCRLQRKIRFVQEEQEEDREGDRTTGRVIDHA